METIKPSPNSPIGIFDSGLGGLTVLKSLERILPNESFLYFGDTAHVPYGTKSTETVIRYSQRIMGFFQKHETKAVVIACNTASAVAYQQLQQIYKIPLFDVVTPSVEYSINITKSKKVGVVGTFSTIQSNAYTKMFKKLGSGCFVKEVPCPLFVPIIEEGWADTAIAKNIAETYLKELRDYNIDTLILGCTHYPLIKDIIMQYINPQTKVLDSSIIMAQHVKQFLIETKLVSLSSNPTTEFYISDDPVKFRDAAVKIIENFDGMVNKINL